MLNFFQKKSHFYLEALQKLSLTPVISPPHQYTIEELETEILQKSLLGVDALKNATKIIKGINVI